jgi:capsular exopolysaccharide synthesis family protein
MKHLEMQKLEQPPYAVEEALNRLRVNVGFCGKEYKKIMVISTDPNEGKSFVTMHLWKMFAETGASTVLLDADMRNSVLQDKYGIEVKGEKLGLSDYLSKSISLEDVLYTTNIPNGSILPNFTNIINPSLLLEGERFSGLLDELGERFEYVFVDCPPLNLVSDGELIGAMCDGAVLVIRADSTPKTLVRNSIGQLERSGCPLLGVVLNRAYAKTGGYYSKYGGKYYGRYGKYGYGNAGGAYYGQSTR